MQNRLELSSPDLIGHIDRISADILHREERFVHQGKRDGQLVSSAVTHEKALQSIHPGVQVISCGITLDSSLPTEYENLVQIIREFVEAPTITDEFGCNHLARRDFYETVKQCDQHLSVWYQRNRLRYNNLLSLSYLSVLYSSLLSRSEDAEALSIGLMRRIPQSSAEYNQMSLPERIENSEKIAETLVEIIAYLEEVETLHDQQALRIAV